MILKDMKAQGLVPRTPLLVFKYVRMVTRCRMQEPRLKRELIQRMEEKQQRAFALVDPGFMAVAMQVVEDMPDATNDERSREMLRRMPVTPENHERFSTQLTLYQMEMDL